MPKGSEQKRNPKSLARTRRILSGRTLSGQSENEAGVEVVDWGYRLKMRFLEWGPTGKTGVDIVPPFEFVALAHLPAE
jgi:hypothetical protein